MNAFLQQLKNRRVFRAAFAYAVAGWLVIQIAAIVLPAFHAADWAVQLVILLVALGFPAALVLAWVYEVTAAGIREPQPAENEGRGATNRGIWLLAAIGLTMAAAVVAGSWLWHPWTHARRAPLASVEAGEEIPGKSIAVLPFENLSDDKQNAYFTDGVQDEILTALSKVGDLRVISRTSVMAYTSDAKRNLREIGKQLGVAHVLEGRVQRIGSRVRVNAQLIDARNDGHLWAETFDRDVSDVFAIQSEIAAAIANQLKAKLSVTEKAAIEERPTSDPAAYDLYVRAKLLNAATSFNPRAEKNLGESARLLDQAVARDPDFFLAYCQLAYAHDHLYFLGFDHTPARRGLGDAAVTNALRLRPDSGEAHLARAQHLYRGYLAYDRARAELEIARRTLPNDPLVLRLAGYIDRRQGRWEESTRNLERALELDPRNFLALQQIGLSYYDLRRYREMAAVLDRALTLMPGDLDTRLTRANVDFAWRADTRPLHAAIETILREDPSNAEKIAESWFTLALCERDPAAVDRAFAALTSDALRQDAVILSRTFGEGLAAKAHGDDSAARKAFEAARGPQEKLVRAQPDYGPALCVLGLIDAGLGRKEEALREGKRAVELLPVTNDSINGAHMIEFFGVICAWVGEKDLAIQQLAIATKLPGPLSYGQLRLHPYWEALRGDPRFEKIVSALAPAK